MNLRKIIDTIYLYNLKGIFSILFLIPLNRLRHPHIKSCLRTPSQFIMNLGNIQGIAHIVPFPIFHKLNQTLWLIQDSTNKMNNFEVAAFLPCPNVIDFSYPSMLENHIDSPAMIMNVKPITYITAIAI